MMTLEITRLPDLDYTSNEALNTLCTNLSFAGENLRKIMLTSCRPHEGKSYITINLMRSMANLGKTAILVDADLRKSILVGRYGIRGGRQTLGLAHYLAGMCTAKDIICKTNIKNAHMILAGQDVINSLPLFSSPRMSALLNDLAGKYDLVLVDTPPIGAIIDSAQIAKACDGVLFVVTADEISRRELKEAKRQIELAGCPVLGAVLNKVEVNKRGYRKGYYAHYQAYYTNSDEGGKGRRRKKKKVVG